MDFIIDNIDNFGESTIIFLQTMKSNTYVVNMIKYSIKLLIGLLGIIIIFKKWIKNYHLTDMRIDRSFFNPMEYPILNNVFQNFNGSLNIKKFINELMKFLNDSKIPQLFISKSLVMETIMKFLSFCLIIYSITKAIKKEEKIEKKK